jgi:hypothetical protein
MLLRIIAKEGTWRLLPNPGWRGPEAQRERRSFAVRFDGADGATLTIKATRNRDASAKTTVTHSTRDGKKVKHARGATEQHASIEAARKRLDTLTAEVSKLGWKKRQPRAGFVRTPDAFDAAHLPAPGRPKKTA